MAKKNDGLITIYVKDSWNKYPSYTLELDPEDAGVEKEVFKREIRKCLENQYGLPDYFFLMSVLGYAKLKDFDLGTM